MVSADLAGLWINQRGQGSIRYLLFLADFGWTALGAIGIVLLVRTDSRKAMEPWSTSPAEFGGAAAGQLGGALLVRDAELGEDDRDVVRDRLA